MAYHVELADRAIRDLRNIYAVLARAWFNGLESMVYSLEHLPNRSPKTPENSQLRHLLYGKKPHVYRIIYRIVDRTKTVRVLHVRYDARHE